MQTEKKPRTSNKPAWDNSPASKLKKKGGASAKPAAKKPVATPPRVGACQTVKSSGKPHRSPASSRPTPDSNSQDAELPPHSQKQTKENIRENGWIDSSR